MSEAFVSEIYASVQGEGPFTGERQIFVRLAGCPLRCSYCDTPGSLVARGHERLSDADAFRRIMKLAGRGGRRIRSVAVTGGEPLAQHGFLSDLLSRLKKKGFRVYLETAGVMPERLAKVIDDCDVVSMDIKLPSATGRAYWNEHRRFLDVAGAKAFAKMVVERRSKPAEVSAAVRLLARMRRPPLLIIQPASAMPATAIPFGSSTTKGADAPTAEQVAEAYAFAKKRLPDVLVMPQQHKIWGVP
ncbi:MAG: 7-carboxy-7-deazaguanine synthase QueE [Elusimicrobia bacterium]|nr:7-carboxy-7-deazaguanine synthase QueE [Elusimicrobiota bacterium]